MFKKINKNTQKSFTFGNGFFRIFSLLFSMIFKSVRTYIFLFIVPALISLVLYIFWTRFSSIEMLPPMILVILMIPSAIIGFFVSIVFLEIKNSVLIKRIKTANISKILFLWTLLLIFTISSFLSQIWSLMFISICGTIKMYGNNVLEMLSNINGDIWIIYLIATIMLSLISITFSLIIVGSIGKKIIVMPVIVISLFVFTIMSGIIIQPYVINDTHFLKYLTFLSPFLYPVWIGLLSTSYQIFDNLGIEQIIPHDFSENVYYQFENIWLPLFVSLAIIGIFVFLMIKFFKWEEKN